MGTCNCPGHEAGEKPGPGTDTTRDQANNVFGREIGKTLPPSQWQMKELPSPPPDPITITPKSLKEYAKAREKALDDLRDKELQEVEKRVMEAIRQGKGVGLDGKPVWIDCP